MPVSYRWESAVKLVAIAILMLEFPVNDSVIFVFLRSAFDVKLAVILILSEESDLNCPDMDSLRLASADQDPAIVPFKELPLVNEPERILFRLASPEYVPGRTILRLAFEVNTNATVPCRFASPVKDPA
jgi:hypothetical protein